MHPGAEDHSRPTIQRPLNISHSRSHRSLVNRVGSSAVGLLQNTVLQPAASQMTSALAASSSTRSKGESSSGHSSLTYEGPRDGNTPQFQTCARRDHAISHRESFRTRQHNRADSPLSTQQGFGAFSLDQGVNLLPELLLKQNPDENVLAEGIQASSAMESRPTLGGIKLPLQGGTDRCYASGIYHDRCPVYEKSVESVLHDYNKQASNRNATNRALQDHELQLMLIEQQNEKRLLQAWQVNRGATHSVNNGWTSPNTDGQAVVTLLSDVNLDLEETTSNLRGTQDSSTLESLLRTSASTAGVLEYTTSGSLAPRVRRKSSSSNPLSLIPNFHLLNQKSHEPRTLNTPATTPHVEESFLPVYAAQALNGEIKPWHDILSTYQDEVWGDLLPLAREARREVKNASEGVVPVSNGPSAVKRLAMVLGHLNSPLDKKKAEPYSVE